MKTITTRMTPLVLLASTMTMLSSTTVLAQSTGFANPNAATTDMTTDNGISYLAQPESLWGFQTDSPINNGNGVFISPKDRVAVVTQANGNLKAFNPRVGRERWSFMPPSYNDLSTSCQGGVTFSFDGPSNFMVYSVTDDPNGLIPMTRVISLNMDGEVNWISVPLEGATAGSPLVSFDGRYVYLTHNSNAMAVGHFSVLDTQGASAGNPVLPLYSEFNTTNPFSPPGIYHKPEEGFYDGGQGNTNDIVVWGHAHNPAVNQVGSGMAFVFQFPVNYIPATTQATGREASTVSPQEYADRQPLFWILLGDSVKDWQADSAPVITNMGRSLYWSVSRSQFRSWVGKAGYAAGRFNRYRSSSPGFGRGTPRWVPPPNTPALSSSPTRPMVFAGSASTEFVKMDYLMNATTAVVRETTSLVRARAVVSPDDKFVYFTEFSGVVHQARTDDLQDMWTITDSAELDGEFALTEDGTVLIVGDVTGNVRAYKVAVVATPAPTASPVNTPTLPPVLPPTATGAPVQFRPPISAPIPVVANPPTQSPLYVSPTQPQPPFGQPTQTVDASAASSQATSMVSAMVATAVVLVMAF